MFKQIWWYVDSFLLIGMLFWVVLETCVFEKYLVENFDVEIFRDVLKPIAGEGVGITKLVVMVLIFATLCLRRAGMIFGGSRPPEVAPLSVAMVSRAAVAATTVGRRRYPMTRRINGKRRRRCSTTVAAATTQRNTVYRCSSCVHHRQNQSWCTHWPLHGQRDTEPPKKPKRQRRVGQIPAGRIGAADSAIPPDRCRGQ